VRQRLFGVQALVLVVPEPPCEGCSPVRDDRSIVKESSLVGERGGPSERFHCLSRVTVVRE
jgi:hypothetical protein